MPANNTRTRSGSSAQIDTCTMADIMDKLNENRLYMESEFKELKATIRALTDRVDTMETKQMDAEKAITFLGDEILDIQKKLSDLDRLKANMDLIQSNLEQQAQLVKKEVKLIQSEKHLHTLRVSGIPHEKNENLYEAVLRLSNKMSCEIRRDDLESVFRPRNNDKTPLNIVLIRFKTTEKRDLFYKSRRKLHSNNSSIYINESLNRDTQALLYSARKRKAELQYNYLWTYHAQIYMRKSKDTEVFKIVNQKTLDNLV